MLIFVLNQLISRLILYSQVSFVFKLLFFLLSTFFLYIIMSRCNILLLKTKRKWISLALKFLIHCRICKEDIIKRFIN